MDEQLSVNRLIGQGTKEPTPLSQEFLNTVGFQLRKLSRVFGRELDEMEVMTYLEQLCDLPLTKIEIACEKALKTLKRMPTIADLRDFANEQSTMAVTNSAIEYGPRTSRKEREAAAAEIGPQIRAKLGLPPGQYSAGNDAGHLETGKGSARLERGNKNENQHCDSNAPRGTVPKTSPNLYPRHGEVHDGTRIGAVLISQNEVRKTFGFDVDRSCTIVEVALYPPDNQEWKVSLGDFLLRLAGTNTAVKPSTAKEVAANLQQQFSVQQDVKAEPYGEVAAGPHHVHTEGQVRVEAVDGPALPASEKDRATLEGELVDKGLPEDKASTPIAGYLYFPMLPRKKHPVFQLDYETNEGKVTLQFSRN
jgi:hypothetical protein